MTTGNVQTPTVASKEEGVRVGWFVLGGGVDLGSWALPLLVAGEGRRGVTVQILCFYAVLTW